MNRNLKRSFPVCAGLAIASLMVLAGFGLNPVASAQKVSDFDRSRGVLMLKVVKDEIKEELL